MISKGGPLSGRLSHLGGDGMKAELIIKNAKILTMDAARPRAEAIALAAGKVLAIGPYEEITALQSSETEVIDAEGKTLLPGFVESHLHIGLGGAELDDLTLTHCHGFDAVAKAYHDFAEANPQRPLLMAQGAHYGILTAQLPVMCWIGSSRIVRSP